MKDLDKDLGNNDIESADIIENKDFQEGEIINAETSDDGEEGRKKNEEGTILEEESLKYQTEAAGEQKEAYGEEDNSFGEEERDGEEKAGGVNPQYSSSYEPPYYVPNFVSVGDSEAPMAEKAKKKRTALKVALICVSCVTLLVAVFFLGVISKGVFAQFFNSQNINLGNEELGSVIQNAPQIDVIYNSDVEYVPKSKPEVVTKVGNSVVEITAYFDAQSSGAGSGVIVAQSDEAGYLLTNHHVITNDGQYGTKINVILNKGESYTASVLASDKDIDLAVLRIKKHKDEQFTVAEFGDSSKLVVGQDILAIGNPLGSLGGTVTDGIVSALDRQVSVDGITMTLLQHSAAINPGNSGGGLFDMMGNLVGVVNAKKANTGIEGLGFAIPSNIAFNYFKRVLVKEPAIGITVGYGKPPMAAYPVGLYVTSTTNSDFVKYDRITKVNDTDISTPADYYAVIDGIELGETFTITVQRFSSRNTFEECVITVVLNK